MIALAWPWGVGQDAAFAFPPWSTPLPEESYYVACVDLKLMAPMSRSSER